MPERNKLTDEEINYQLTQIPLWKLEGNTIVREIVSQNFSAAVGLVFSIAVIAESMDHHPDILVYGWNKLRITLSTHDIGGLSMMDFTFAQKVESLFN